VTKQCILVLRETDFSIAFYRKIEILLTKHMAQVVIHHVWKIDPKGIYGELWHIRRMERGLPIVKDECIVSVDFTERFWEVYDVISTHLRPFGIRSMLLINEMQDLNKVKMVLPYSRSLYQLHENYVSVPEFNVPDKIEKHRIKKSELD